jgi:hypothetical protein
VAWLFVVSSLPFSENHRALEQKEKKIATACFTMNGTKAEFKKKKKNFFFVLFGYNIRSKYNHPTQGYSSCSAEKERLI